MVGNGWAVPLLPLVRISLSDNVWRRSEAALRKDGGLALAHTSRERAKLVAGKRASCGRHASDADFTKHRRFL